MEKAGKEISLIPVAALTVFERMTEGEGLFTYKDTFLWLVSARKEKDLTEQFA